MPRRVDFALGMLLLSVLALGLLLPASAIAASNHYVLAADSTITLTGESAQPLVGTLDLTYRGFCVVPFDLATCALFYDLDSLDLAGGGESVALGAITPIIDALPVLTLWDFGIPYPDPPHLDLVIGRETQPAQLPGEARYLERIVLSPDANTAPSAIFDGDNPLPSEIFFDVEFIEKQLLQILGGGGMAHHPTTVSTEVVARLAIHAVAVPEPGSAVLASTVLIALAVLCTARPRRTLGARL